MIYISKSYYLKSKNNIFGKNIMIKLVCFILCLYLCQYKG